MTDFETPVNKVQANEKFTIPPSPFLFKLGFETDVELYRSRRAILAPSAFRSMSKGKPNKECKRAEKEIVQRVSHPNIAGFCMSSKRSMTRYLATKGCAQFLGEMIERKIENNYEQILPKQILKVAADVAGALDYLHTKLQLLHGDIRSYNILVEGNFDKCELCDFTSAAPLDGNGVFDKEKAGLAVYPGIKSRWSAPEVIREGEVSSKTDIWSLGLTLWETMTLVPPHAVPGCTAGAPAHDAEDPHHTFGTLKNYYTARYGTRPAVPVNVSETQYMHALTLFYWSTESAAARRPSARQLCRAAQDMLTHLHYGLWFPHLSYGVPLCLKS
ncbi:hypothetical protein PYW08_012387 [Mythimna loreyi]|uniref:Uncharacterized protein n=1 Tax=Mythimna loreyi TaxID=667449 RepID=A0ACC2Q1A8_9NEOP|nr:hypothetical protein PYW08_012387 [Mythimna loreyi]